MRQEFLGSLQESDRLVGYNLAEGTHHHQLK